MRWIEDIEEPLVESGLASWLSVIGIDDISKPDFGDSVTIKPGEEPVFWPCGVTPQSALMSTKPPIAITHSPGHMLITDVKNVELKY